MIHRAISYEPLWRIMVNRKLPKKYLCENDTGYHITTRSLSKLSQNGAVSLNTLLRICDILECDLNDICETLIVEDSDYLED